MGMDDPMMLTVFMGIVNISFTLVAVFTVEKLGRKPLLICGSLGMALGAFGVALTFGNDSLAMVTAASRLPVDIKLYRELYVRADVQHAPDGRR